MLSKLKLPASTGASNWWLTEIEDQWPYKKAAGDVYFSPVAKQITLDRNTMHHNQMDASALVMLAGFIWVVRLKKSS
ncbi:MAG: hypothetical protein OSA84_01845 [Akkermansiaceae bacterium]|nr:hypothetical protein [Akkermansiaceae bacterium]